MTQKEQIRDYVKQNPCTTASNIAKATGLRAANVSSVLIKGYIAGQFKREKQDGVKGWVYYVL